MKRLIWVLTIVAVTTGTALADGHQPAMERGGSFENESMVYTAALARELAETNADREIGSFTVEELAGAARELSIAQQKDQYLTEIRVKSMLFPGAGHFKTGHTGRGVLFGTASLAVSAGTLAGWYYLLPEDVQFDNVNYYADSFATIKEAWEGQSLESLLPSLGAMLGGVFVQGIVSGFAAADAENLAKEQIASGEVQFQPQPILMMGPNMPMMGMKFSY